MLWGSRKSRGMLQWGRRPATAETTKQKAEREATIMLQWGRRPATAETEHRRRAPHAGRRCFNGAAVLRRRRRGGDAKRGRTLRASMGPPSCDGGNWGFPAMLLHADDVASMGPPSCDGGDHTGGPRERVAHHVASMGPPSCDGGDLHGEVDGQIRRRASMGPPSCDGGDAPRGRPALLPLVPASMGPPSCDGGDSGSSRTPAGSTSCFNGAAVLRRRRRPAKIRH